MAMQSPEDMPLLFAKAWNARDPKALAALFAEDADFVNVVGIWWHDRQAIEKAHAYGLEVIFPDSQLKVLKTTTRLLEEKVAVVQSRMRLSGQTNPNGKEPLQDRWNIFTFVMHQTTAGWQCVTAHNTDIVAGAETHIRQGDGNLKPADYRKK